MYIAVRLILADSAASVGVKTLWCTAFALSSAAISSASIAMSVRTRIRFRVQLVAYIATTVHLRRDVIPAAAPTVVDVSAETAGTSVPIQKNNRGRKSA
ncbi:hypothetical protein GCM10010260_84300 [Streptomyces filipinensis]|uniref:Uncharacterized protein n=1 Tax=Streptomyces filipinensis TaxID=66887 RepID=A0A918ILV1_9ACTN|nr:hypothetical protein GCM10010260_84300 [Streptomyces filipinensis]